MTYNLGVEPLLRAIAPDLGERYLDTIHQSNWVRDSYGEDVLSTTELTAGSRAA